MPLPGLFALLALPSRSAHQLVHLCMAVARTALLAAGTAATTISASLGTASLVFSGAVAAGHFGSSWLVWWTGDAMGIVLVAPVLWSLRGPHRALNWLQVAEAIGLLALLVGTVLLAASNQGPGLFIVLLPLVWIAWRFQQQGAGFS